MTFLGRQTAKIVAVILTAPFMIFAAGIILPLGVIVVILFVGKIEQDFWTFVSPVLEKFLTTDRQNIILSKSLMIFQFASCLLYLIYFFYNSILLQKHVQDRLETIKNRVRLYYPEGYAKLILADMNRKDKLMITAAHRDFYLDVEENFKESEFRDQPRPNEKDFQAFYKREIERR